MIAVATEPKIYLHLHAPDTTLVHRAGILGLWMTLKQLEKQFPTPSCRLGELSWNLTPYSVSLDWTGQDQTVLDWLLKQAFQIDERGLISLTGLNPQSMPLINKIHLHQVLTGTLLQHNQFITTIAEKDKVPGTQLPKTAPHLLLWCLITLPVPWQFYLLLKGQPNPQASIRFKVDEVELTLNYKQLTSYIHQDFSDKLCHKTTHQWINGYIPIVSWLYPGAVIRHNLINKYNQCREKTDYALALLFLPVACHYLTFSKGINEQIKSTKTHPTKYLLLIPDPINLEQTAQIRWRLNRSRYRDLYVSTLGEAALSYYAKEVIHHFSVQRCQVILYGKLMKDSWLRNPIDIQDFKITKIILKNYQLTCRYLPKNKLIQTKNNFLIRLNLIRGMITDNFLNQKPIWSDLCSTLKQQNFGIEIKQQLKYNQHGLFNLMKNSDQITQVYNAFIDVIHEALKIIYAQIYQDNPEVASKKIERENERFKSKLLNCNTEETFRHLMAKFLSRASHLSTLHKNQKLILPILIGKNDWKEARDITLIALSSYPIRERLNRETLAFFIFTLLFEAQLYQLAFIFL